MEQAFEGIGTVLNAMLGLAIVVGPGVLFWLVVVGVIMAVRRVVHRGSLRGVRHESQATSSPSTVKS